MRKFLFIKLTNHFLSRGSDSIYSVNHCYLCAETMANCFVCTLARGVQDLSVTVTCDRSVDEVSLVPSPTEVSQVDRRGAADSQEWKIFHHVDVSLCNNYYTIS